MPGKYGIRMTFGDKVETTEIEVVYDPRLEVTTQELTAKYQSLKGLEASSARATQAVKNLKDALSIAEKMEKGMKDKDKEGFKEMIKTVKSTKDTLNSMLDVFFGKEDDTFFGQLERNTNVFMGIRWSF